VGLIYPYELQTVKIACEELELSEQQGGKVLIEKTVRSLSEVPAFPVINSCQSNQRGRARK